MGLIIGKSYPRIDLDYLKAAYVKSDLRPNFAIAANEKKCCLLNRSIKKAKSSSQLINLFHLFVKTKATIPNPHVLSNFIRACSKFEIDIEEILSLFYLIPHSLRDTFVYNSILASLADEGRDITANKIFSQMPTELKDRVTYSIMIDLSASKRQWSNGMSMIMACLEEDIYLLYDDFSAKRWGFIRKVFSSQSTENINTIDLHYYKYGLALFTLRALLGKTPSSKLEVIVGTHRNENHILLHAAVDLSRQLKKWQIDLNPLKRGRVIFRRCKSGRSVCRKGQKLGLLVEFNSGK